MSMNDTILESMLQLAECGVMTTDANLVVNGWNNWLAEKTGFSSEQVLGKRLVDIFPDLVRRRLDLAYQRALNGQVVVLAQRLHEYLLKAHSGTNEDWSGTMKQSARIAPLVEGERILGTLTVIDDVTDRVEHDNELATRARQQATIASISQQALAGRELDVLMRLATEAVAATLRADRCAVWELDVAAQTLELRAGAGWKEEAIGAVALELSEESKAIAGQARLAGDIRLLPALGRSGLFDERQTVSETNAAISAGDRQFGLLSAYAAGSGSFSGEDFQFMQTVADVIGMAIDRKRLETELQERVEDLAAADRRKDEFLAMLAHELRNPLAPIMHAVEFLERHPSGDPNVEAARGIIDQQVRQMSRLVDDLLDVSRITRGQISLQMEELALTPIINQAIENARPMIESHEHALSAVLPAEPLTVRGDATRLTQVVTNLLNNAAKYTDKGGRIVVTLARDDDHAAISVRDNGIGIAPEVLPHVFDLFMQVDNSLARSRGGLGIGLTLVRNMAVLHGGSVAARSAGLGQGSEFILRLPLAVAKPKAADATMGRRKPLDLPSRRLLVVDDNQDAANTLAMLLKAVGHNVTVAYDGAQALESAEIVEPEIIFLDIGLPGMDGYEVARRVRMSPLGDRVKLVALTGYGQEEDRKMAHDAGFDHHLVKPVAWDRLQEVLHEALQRDAG